VKARGWLLARFAVALFAAILANPTETAAALPRSLPQFIGFVSADLDLAWRQKLRAVAPGLPYWTPGQVYVYAPTYTACGVNVAPGMGPFYCGGTIFLDMPLLARIWQDDTNDFAVAIVVAHEWAHHIQLLTGVSLPRVAYELQADCLAGYWAGYEHYMGRLDPGDLEEAVTMSWVAGDQGGDISHGTGEQRVAAFLRGFQSEGDLSRC
jgi:predicted metalloprotease